MLWRSSRARSLAVAKTPAAVLVAVLLVAVLVAVLLVAVLLVPRNQKLTRG